MALDHGAEFLAKGSEPAPRVQLERSLGDSNPHAPEEYSHYTLRFKVHSLPILSTVRPTSRPNVLRVSAEEETGRGTADRCTHRASEQPLLPQHAHRFLR